MKRELIIKKCKKCGALVKIIKDCTCENCGIKCCNEQMEILIPNTENAIPEKHIPTYEKVENEIYVTVNHPMEKEHYIEWISLVTENKEFTEILYPEQNAECRFPYIPGAILYVYCNTHGLWEEEIK